MLTLEQLAPQLVALVAVLSMVGVLGYLGVKHALRFLLALRRGAGRETWSRSRTFLCFVWGANVAMVGLFAYGWLWEADWVERVHVTVEADVPERLRIVHLSDLHLEGFGLREERALAIVEEAAPDLIVLTGDYLSKNTGKRHEAHLRRFVSLLPSSIGAFAVPGNWDTDGKVFEGTRVQYLPGADVLGNT